MKNLLRCVLFTKLLLLGCCGSSLDGKEAEVYAAYVDAHFTTFADSQEPLKRHVICDTTAGFQIVNSWEKEISKLPIKPADETAESFISRNGGTPKGLLTEKERRIRGRYAVNSDLRFKLPHVLIRDSLVEKLFFTDGSEGWPGFNARYPKSHGIIWLSRVGFNTARTEALLYIGNQWTEGAGEGFVVLLRKAAGRWAEVAKASCWIS